MFHKYRILIYSENPDELMKFYRDVLELELDEANSLKLPNDYGYMFTVNGPARNASRSDRDAGGDWKLWIGRHSEIKGPSKEPFRHIFNLYVDSVGEWYRKIKAKGVKIVSEPCETPFSTPNKPVWVSTFLDPENNCFQFMGLP